MFGHVARAGVRSSALLARRGLSSSAKPKAAATKPQAGGNTTPMIAAAAGMITMLILGSGSSSSPAKTEVKHETPAVPVPAENAENAEPEAPKAVTTDDDVASRVAALEGTVAVLSASLTNEAFVFIKPHAVTDKVVDLVKSGLRKAGIRITAEKTLSHATIDDNKLIDTHYGAIASKAVLLKPAELNVPAKGQEGFQKMFSESWSDAVAAGKVYNAADACAKLGISGEELDGKWSSLSRGENLIKFGGGFYCGKLADDVYVMNGFYMAMRQKYCAAPAQLTYLVVQWDPAQLSWADFRGKVLGATDPSEAAAGSLRRAILDDWQALGLAAQPDVGDNGVHASASPFEACAERVNWTGAVLEEDRFGKAMLALGIDKATLQSWMQDAQVKVAGKSQSIFDALEDRDARAVLDALAEMRAEN